MTIYPIKINKRSQEKNTSEYRVTMNGRTQLIFDLQIVTSNNLEYVQAYVAMHIKIGVEAGCFKLDFWRLERVVIGEGE